MLVGNKVLLEGCVLQVSATEIYKSRPWATPDKKCERVDGSKVARREISGR